MGYLTSIGEIEDAILQGSAALDGLGKPLPAQIMNITDGMCIREYIMLKFRLGLKTEQKILELPRMSNKHILVLMDFLQCIFSTSTDLPNPRFAAIITFRMVNQ